MKRLIALGAATVALVVAAPAGAATPVKRISKLEAQVKALTAQTKALQSQLKALQARERVDRSEISANYTGDACIVATMADLFQSTWATIDQGAATPRFSQETQTSDKDACSAIQVTRHGIKQPPSITSIVNSLISWLIG